MKPKLPYQIKMLSRTTDYYRQHLAEHLLSNQKRQMDLLDTSGFQRGIDRLAVRETLERQSSIEDTHTEIGAVAA